MSSILKQEIEDKILSIIKNYPHVIDYKVKYDHDPYGGYSSTEYSFIVEWELPSKRRLKIVVVQCSDYSKKYNIRWMYSYRKNLFGLETDIVNVNASTAIVDEVIDKVLHWHSESDKYQSLANDRAILNSLS